MQALVKCYTHLDHSRAVMRLPPATQPWTRGFDVLFVDWSWKASSRPPDGPISRSDDLGPSPPCGRGEAVTGPVRRAQGSVLAARRLAPGPRRDLQRTLRGQSCRARLCDARAQRHLDGPVPQGTSPPRPPRLRDVRRRRCRGANHLYSVSLPRVGGSTVTVKTPSPARRRTSACARPI